jgi:hypothetical protein
MATTLYPIGISPFQPIADFRAFATTPGARVTRKDTPMTNETAQFVRMANKVYVAALRAERGEDQATRRAELVVTFEQLCTDTGRLCIGHDRPKWHLVKARAHDLLLAAIDGESTRIDAMVSIGAITARIAAIAMMADALGMRVALAETADEEIEQAARLTVEGEHAEAAE